MNTDSNFINNMIQFMDIYDKFRQYIFVPEPNKWFKLGSVSFPDSNGNHHFKFDIIYGDKINDEFQSNNIVVHFTTDYNNKYNRYGKFYGNVIAYETNNNTNLKEIKLLQTDGNKYDIWIYFGSYYGKCLLFIYGNYNFNLICKKYDIIDVDYPILAINRLLIINKEYIENNYYNKTDIENMIGFNNNSELEKTYVKKTELDNRLLNLVLKSNNITSAEILNMINGSLDNYYFKKSDINDYIKKNMTYDIFTLDDKFDKKADKNDLANMINKKDLLDYTNNNNLELNYVKKDDLQNFIINNSALKDFYNKSSVNILLNSKADNNNVYSKNDIDIFLNSKANCNDIYIKSNTYNRTELKELLDRKVSSYNGTLENPTILNPTFFGNITGLDRSKIGLSEVDNTSDLNKPTSLHTLELLKYKANVNDMNLKADKSLVDTKAPLNNPIFTGIVKGITKDMIGLSYVDNTADINKPISKQMQTFLNQKANIEDLNKKASIDDVNLKAPINNPNFTGVVKGITKHMVGLENVDNTSDENKPLSKEIRNQLNLKANSTDLDKKAPINNPSFTGIVSGISKEMVGLDNVDNTSDLNKPVSNPVLSELNKKAPLNNPIFTGIVSGITKNMIGLNNVDNTTDIDKPISNATQLQLNLKAPLNNPSFTGIVSGITKNMIGLNNIDNTADINKPVSIPIQNELNNKVDNVDSIMSGKIQCNNLIFQDINDTTLLTTSNNKLILGSNNNNNIQINEKGQITQLDANIDNDYSFKLQNLSSNNGFGLLIDQNDTAYSLCIRDKSSKIKANIGSNGSVSMGGNGNAFNILPNGFIGINVIQPSYNLEINGTAFCSSGLWSGSDERIKENITDVNTSEILDKVNKIELKKYDYIDKKMGNTEYGVIAQQIKNIFPETIKTVSKVIPSIMKFSQEFIIDEHNNALIKLHNLNIDLSIGMTIRICSDDLFDDVMILNILNDTIKVKLNKIFNKTNTVFIYGHLINDFHSVDKTNLLMPLIGAVQELYKMVNQLNNRQ